MAGGIERIHGAPLLYTEGIYSVELNPGLQEWEVEDAWKIVRWVKGNGPFLGIAGTMLVSGPRRQGKGLFGNVFSWKTKRYYGSKKVLRDDHPTELFGRYTLFNEDTLIADVAAMSDVAEADIPRETRKTAEKARLANQINEWRTSEHGDILIQNSIILKDEFWKDMNKRRPMTPMNLLFGGILKTCYHSDTMVVGIIQRVSDLDRFTCLPDVNLHAKCTWCATVPNTTLVTLYHVQWSDARQQLIPTGKPSVIYLDGGARRPELGGARYFDIFKSKSAPNLRSLNDRTYLDSGRDRR